MIYKSQTLDFTKNGSDSLNRNLVTDKFISDLELDGITFDDFNYTIIGGLDSAGLRISETLFAQNENYVISYLFKVVERGEYKNNAGNTANTLVIGGHCPLLLSKVVINGIEQTNPEEGYLKGEYLTGDATEYKVELYGRYNADTWSDDAFYIQPRRNLPVTVNVESFKVEICELQVEKGTKATSWVRPEYDKNKVNNNLLVIAENSKGLTLQGASFSEYLEFYGYFQSTKTLTLRAVTDRDEIEAYYRFMDPSESKGTTYCLNSGSFYTLSGEISIPKEVTDGDQTVSANFGKVMCRGERTRNEDDDWQPWVDSTITTEITGFGNHLPFKVTFYVPKNTSGCYLSFQLYPNTGSSGRPKGIQAQVYLKNLKLEEGVLQTALTSQMEWGLNSDNFSWRFSSTDGMFMYNGAQSVDNEIFKIYNAGSASLPEYKLSMKGRIESEDGQIASWTLTKDGLHHTDDEDKLNFKLSLTENILINLTAKGETFTAAPLSNIFLTPVTENGKIWLFNTDEDLANIKSSVVWANCDKWSICFDGNSDKVIVTHLVKSNGKVTEYKRGSKGFAAWIGGLTENLT